MRGILKSLTVLVIAGTLAAGAEAKNLGSGEMATYVPIPTYGLVKGELEEKGNCQWEISVSAKQLGGKEINLGEFRVPSPNLCQYKKDLQMFYSQDSQKKKVPSWLSDPYTPPKRKKPDLESYLKGETVYLNGLLRDIYSALKGKVGTNTVVFSMHYPGPGSEWYYTGSILSGMVISYGWQKKPTGNSLAFYYNSTAGKISDQAPKPTDRPDQLPVLNFTGNLKVEKIGNELNKKIRGGYKEEVYTSGKLTSEEYVDKGHKYDTFAETYTDKACNGSLVTYSAEKKGKGIVAFEKEVVIPELQKKNKDEAVVTFYYSPTIVDVEDKVTDRRLIALCPPNFTFSCKEDKCVRYVQRKTGSGDGRIAVVLPKKETVPARVVFRVNHAITAKLVRTVRTDIVSADGKVSTIYNQDLPLPDYHYNTEVERYMGSSYKEALKIVKDKSLSDYECTWGELEPYTGDVPLTGTCSVDYKEPEPPSISPPPSKQPPLQVGVMPRNPGGGDGNVCSGKETFKLILGKIGDNYWEGYCKIFTLRTSFYVSDPSKVESFRLARAKFDDYIEVKVNGRVVYVGPYGGTKLELVTEGQNTYVNYGTGTGPCELATNWDRKPNIELKDYLRRGVNNVEINVEVYRFGEGYVSFDGRAIGDVVRCLDDKYCKLTRTGCTQ